MQSLLILILFLSVVPVYQAFGVIDAKNNAIFLSAKSTLEECYTPQSIRFNLCLKLPDEHIASNAKIEAVGNYLNVTSDEVLRMRIEKNFVSKGKVLLGDFLKTESSSILHKKLEAFVCAMLSCNFLIPDECKTLCERKIFYPEDYEIGAYKWELSLKDNKIDALVGRLHKVVGLKRDSRSWLNVDDLIAIINITYTCRLRHVETRTSCFRGDNVTMLGSDSNAYIEPRHDMEVSITFLRKRFFEGCSTVSYVCHAFGAERIFPPVQQEIQDDCAYGKFSTSMFDNIFTFDPHNMKQDFQESARGQYIREQFTMANAMDLIDWHDLSDQCATNFIINVDREEA